MLDVTTLRRLKNEVGRTASQASNAEDACIDIDAEAASGYSALHALLVVARFALDQAEGVLDATEKNAAAKAGA